jgi:choline dehydrogenase-like flavoprotein
MLSGIGPADHLREHGLAAAHDLGGVGGNLQDHLDICTLQHSTQPVTYDRLSDTAVAFQYFTRHQGPGTSNVAEAGGFVRSRLATGEDCDVQFHFVPAMLDDHGRNRLPGYGYTLHACMLRPKSRGAIRLHCADPAAPAKIQANYLSDTEGYDLKTMIEAAKLSREIFAQAPFDKYRGEEIFPGAGATSDADLEAFIRRKAETIYHPTCTCRMGKDEGAVVDSELRVRGIQALRVVDASIMPTLTGGNTNAPTIMIAERAADLLTS